MARAAATRRMFAWAGRWTCRLGTLFTFICQSDLQAMKMAMFADDRERMHENAKYETEYYFTFFFAVFFRLVS
jgi:hypothetical protein